jgi:hypothetical protein
VYLQIRRKPSRRRPSIRRNSCHISAQSCSMILTSLQQSGKNDQDIQCLMRASKSRCASCSCQQRVLAQLLLLLTVKIDLQDYCPGSSLCCCALPHSARAAALNETSIHIVLSA